MTLKRLVEQVQAKKFKEVLSMYDKLLSDVKMHDYALYLDLLEKREATRQIFEQFNRN